MYKVVPEEIWNLALRKLEKLASINSRTEDEMNEFRAWALLLSMDLPTKESKKIMAAMNPESEPQNRVGLSQSTADGVRGDQRIAASVWRPCNLVNDRYGG